MDDSFSDETARRRATVLPRLRHSSHILVAHSRRVGARYAELAGCQPDGGRLEKDGREGGRKEQGRLHYAPPLHGIVQ